MKKTENQLYGLLAVSTIFWFGLDQLTKAWAVSEGFAAMQFIPNLFYLAPYQLNDGIAFGIDAPSILQIGGSIVIIFLLIKYGMQSIQVMKKWRRSSTLMLGFVIGGGLGNLVDRISAGVVVDFIVLKPIPVFNVADIGITVGLAALFVTMLLDQKTK